jgi:hypothetical protein
MSRYGLSYYGLATSTYGGENPVSYIATNFSAMSQAYTDTVTGNRYPRIYLKWDSPTGNWSEIRLVRNTYGYPVDAWDGKILLTEEKELDPIKYYDQEYLAGGEFSYYSLFVYQLDSYSWVRVGDAIGLSVYPYGNGQKLYDWMPEITKVTQIYNATQDYDNDALKGFLNNFGFQLDYAQTLASLLINRYDLQKVSGTLLPSMLQQFGLSYEPEIGYQQSRILVRDAIDQVKKKGSAEGFREYMKAFSGWAIPSTIAGTPNPSVEGVVLGHNLMLDYNDSSFEESNGHWISSDATANLYNLKVKNVTYAQLAGGVATFTIGSHNYQVNNKFSISGFYQPLFNVAGAQTVTARTDTTISFNLAGTNVSLFKAFNTTSNEYPKIKPYPASWNEPTALALSPNKQLGILALKNKSASSQTIKINCGSNFAVTNGIPVSASTSYVFSVYSIAGSTVRNVTAGIDWYTRQGVYISSSAGTPLSNVIASTFSSGSRPYVIATSPATAYYAAPSISVVNAGASASNEFHYFDCAQFEQSASLTEFDEARQIHLTMKATRINELKNPHFASPTTPWSITGATTLVDGTVAEPTTDIYAITKKKIDANYATLTTLYTHNFKAGNVVVISGIGSPFDGTYTLTGTTGKTLTYAKVNVNIAEVATTGTAYISANALKVTATATSVLIKSATTSSDYMPIYYPSTNYIFSIYSKVNSGSINITPTILWYNSSKTLISSESGTPYLIDATGTDWDRPSLLGFAPSNAAYAEVRVSYTTTIGAIAWFDSALFENNSNVLEFFSGSGGPGNLTDFYWEGNAANQARSHYYKNAFAIQSRIANKAFTDQLILGSTVAVYLAQPQT